MAELANFINKKIRHIKSMKKSLLKKAVILGTVSVILYFVIVTIVDISLMGCPLLRFSDSPNESSYIIPDSVRIDMQTDFKCSAFSSAYVMRQFGEDAFGDSIYESIPDKMDDGYVYPKGIRKYLTREGYRVDYCIGNLNALKKAVSADNGVIVMIKIRPDKDWLHYVPVVGYTPDSIYIAESLPDLINTRNPKYNRSLSKNEFEQLWDTSAFKMPLFRNTFFIIKKNNDQQVP